MRSFGRCVTLASQCTRHCDSKVEGLHLGSGTSVIAGSEIIFRLPSKLHDLYAVPPRWFGGARIEATSFHQADFVRCSSPITAHRSRP